jgi:AbiV family abortive infection protein
MNRQKTEPNKILQAMTQSLLNAKQFLHDSKVLSMEKSLGHATSLAILGFEEAHKAYLLIQLLPIMEKYTPARQKKDVRRQLDKHLYKLKTAMGYQVFLQYLAYEYSSEAQRKNLKERFLKMKEHRDKNPALKKKPLGFYLNKLKNRGFYVEPFAADGVWTPSDMPSSDFEGACDLLQLHIALVQDVVEFYLDPDLVLPDEVHTEMSKISRAIAQTRGRGLSRLRNELDKAGGAAEKLKGFLEFLEDFYDVKGRPRRKSR